MHLALTTYRGFDAAGSAISLRRRCFGRIMVARQYVWELKRSFTYGETGHE